MFIQSTYIITASAGANGNINPAGNDTVNYGANQEFTITPNSCYHIDSIIVDGSYAGKVSSYTFTNVTANHTIRSVFAIGKDTIVATSGANGSITPPGSTILNCGGSQTFTITANPCYHIDSVLVDGSYVGKVASYSFSNVTVNHSIRTVFAVNRDTITATAGSNGTINPSGSTVLNCGSNQTYTITANSCYHIDSVLVDGVNQGAISSYTFTNVTANHTIRSVYKITTYTITPTSGPDGSITPSSVTTVNCGSNQTFTMTPNSTYHVDSLLVDGVNQGQLTSYTFTNVTANHTIRVVFDINTYTLTIQIQGSGTVTPLPDEPTYTHGTSVRLTAIGDIVPQGPVKPGIAKGMHFDHWEIDATGTTNPLTITMDRNKTIKAVFVLN
jgi:Tfp pilus assembly protein PilX